VSSPTRKPIAEGSEWTFEALEDFEREIGRIAVEKYRLDTYPNQIEIISADQMMDAYSSVGMPVGYHHWSFGKQFLSTEQRYRKGHIGLAYELVINSNPCIAYLMEENTLTLQALVIAHACFGHNSFFKNNYLFKTWTDASAIVNYILFARGYIAECEERYGVDEVEELLDSCHALMNLGVDRFRRPRPITPEKERERQKEREEYLQRQVNDLWRTIPGKAPAQERKWPRFPPEPQENLLYFIEKNAPLLEPWEREIVRIVRKIAQYFYPQRQTKVMNEGWATFMHYNLMNDLYDEGLITEGAMLEFLQSHSNVIFQPPYDSPFYSGINPYTLGFAIFRDIRRVCENPADEDRRFFPEHAGSDWLETAHHAMQNFKDESFILQFLSPKVIRDLKLFSILDDDTEDAIEVAAIHDDAGYRRIREALAEQYNLSQQEADIQVWEVNLRGDRSLTLRHTQHDRIPLHEDDAREVMKHVHRLWQFDVRLESRQDGELTKSYHCDAECVRIIEGVEKAATAAPG
jgi:spore cortex formation protein SpoVR/YcgB (stage V sporulation)